MKLENTEAGTAIAFRCKPEMKARIEAVAADEGLSLGAVVKRAVLRDLRARKQEPAADVA
jgi:hypothetical protein